MTIVHTCTWDMSGEIWFNAPPLAASAFAYRMEWLTDGSASWFGFGEVPGIDRPVDFEGKALDIRNSRITVSECDDRMAQQNQPPPVARRQLQSTPTELGVGLPPNALPRCADLTVMNPTTGALQPICGLEATCTDTPLLAPLPPSPPAPPLPVPAYAANNGIGNICETGFPVTTTTDCKKAAEAMRQVYRSFGNLPTANLPTTARGWGTGGRTIIPFAFAPYGCMLYDGPAEGFQGIYLNRRWYDEPALFTSQASPTNGTADHHKVCSLRSPPPSPPSVPPAMYAVNTGIGNTCETGWPITTTVECAVAAAALGSTYRSDLANVEFSASNVPGGCHLYTALMHTIL